jgi:hypothetical protein
VAMDKRKKKRTKVTGVAAAAAKKQRVASVARPTLARLGLDRIDFNHPYQGAHGPPSTRRRPPIHCATSQWLSRAT